MQLSSDGNGWHWPLLRDLEDPKEVFNLLTHIFSSHNGLVAVLMSFRISCLFSLPLIMSLQWTLTRLSKVMIHPQLVLNQTCPWTRVGFQLFFYVLEEHLKLFPIDSFAEGFISEVWHSVVHMIYTDDKCWHDWTNINLIILVRTYRGQCMIFHSLGIIVQYHLPQEQRSSKSLNCLQLPVWIPFYFRCSQRSVPENPSLPVPNLWYPSLMKTICPLLSPQSWVSPTLILSWVFFDVLPIMLKPCIGITRYSASSVLFFIAQRAPCLTLRPFLWLCAASLLWQFDAKSLTSLLPLRRWFNYPLKWSNILPFLIIKALSLTMESPAGAMQHLIALIQVSYTFDLIVRAVETLSFLSALLFGFTLLQLQVCFLWWLASWKLENKGLVEFW